MWSFHHITPGCQTWRGEEGSAVGKIEGGIIQISFLVDERGDEVFSHTKPGTSVECLAFLLKDEVKSTLFDKTGLCC